MATHRLPDAGAPYSRCLAKKRARPSAPTADPFGPTVQFAGAELAGRPRLPIRLIVALLHLKHAFNPERRRRL